MYWTTLLEMFALSIITTTSPVIGEEPSRVKARVLQEMLVAWMLVGLKDCWSR